MAAALYEIDNEQEYESEISQCVWVTGYHHWFFLSAMTEALNLKFRAVTVESHGKRLGVVPLLFRRRGPISTVNYLPIGVIGPLLRGETLRERRASELVRSVEPILRRHRTAVTQWAFPPGLNMSADQLKIPGFDIFEAESYVIPGSKSVDDCVKGMSRVRRQSIRQSEARGAIVSESSIDDITKWLPEQIGGAQQRHGLLPYKLSEARVLTERLAAHPRMLWRTVRGTEGDILGMTGCVIGDDRLWGWLMAGPPTAGLSAHSLCYWDLIRWSRPRGLSYDLGGVPTEGIRKFKVSLGADVETFLTAVRMRPKAVYTAGQAIYNWAATRLAARHGGAS
jgi:hypothetical protein